MSALPPSPGHRPSRAIIDLSAWRNNLAAAKARANADVMAVVKSNAYGHGMIECARAAADLGVPALGVATADEALCLRETEGLGSIPILVMGPTKPEDADPLQRALISVAVGTEELLEAHLVVAEKFGLAPRLHLKINTGMNRYGFPAFRADVLERFRRIPEALEGIMTHYSVSDSKDPDDIAYTNNQRASYKEFCQKARSLGLQFQQHASNSGAVIHHPGESFDFVRPGIMLYGANPEPADGPLDDLSPVLFLATEVAALYEYPAGTEVSYGRTYSMPKDGRIALLPIGYGDGVPRRLSNVGHVLIRGQRAPIAGRVCMDQILIDVTNIPEVSVGDEVVLVGRQGDGQITLEEIAMQVGSIPYEVTCQLTSRVPRVYVD